MIDQATINQVLDTAEIVDVVSDFVSLKRRGANYIACCPFHNEKTPSFSVSPSKGIYKCFGCGKAGNSVSFVMEHEQLSYIEAIKYLGNKYGIDVKDRDENPEDTANRLKHESLLIVSELAQKYYTDTLFNNDMARAVGLSYFRQKRGFSDETIKKFGLGFSLDARNSNSNYQSFSSYALKAGYKKEFIIGTGLGIERTDGSLVDKFYDRAMFPIHSISGKVIAFGGRTLLTDKSVAKYVNSPETEIYHKSKSLYGIFQAKSSMSKLQKCYLVEGYADVLSFHQAGIENVVASSGTSLTREQIRLIRRFTNKVTVLYDGDEAGIKASIRGIDLLLEEGMEIKVVLLPDGDDPDSFAMKHSESEIREFLDKAETDFIEFKYQILSKNIERDPIQKARLIHEIIRTIALIPDQIMRNVYIDESSNRLDIKQAMMIQEVAKVRKKLIESGEFERRREEEREARIAERKAKIAQENATARALPLGNNSEEDMTSGMFYAEDENLPYYEDYANQPTATKTESQNSNNLDGIYDPEELNIFNTVSATQVCEKELLYYLVRFGEYKLIMDISIAQYISAELENDDLEFLNSDLLLTYKEYYKAQQEEISFLKQEGVTLSAVEPCKIQERIQRRLINHPNNKISTLIPDLLYDEYNLNIKEFCKSIIPEENILGKIVPKAVLIFKSKYTEHTHKETIKALSLAQKKGDIELQKQLLQQIKILMMVRNQFSKELKRLT